MKQFAIVMVVVVVILFSSCATSLVTGPVRISFQQTFRSMEDIFRGSAPSNLQSSVLFSIRMPRILSACIVGWCLAVSGLCFQSLLRNALAEPYTLGLASGAAIGAVLGSLLKFHFAMSSTIFAFAGALLITGMILLPGRNRKYLETGSIILSGLILSALGNAVLSLVLSILSPNQLHTFFFWFMGSFSMAQWSTILISLPIVLILSVVIFLLSWNMNALSVNEDLAEQVGVHVIRTRAILYLAASLLTAIAVSLAGTIGFIGLIVPHLGRLMIGPDNRLLIPIVAILGATFCVLSDLVARSLLAPAELPVGVITAFVGAPVFLYFMMRKAR